MPGMMVALRWDGPRLSEDELVARASAATNKVSVAFDHVDQLDIQALPDEGQQYVQLIINTSATQSECERMRDMLKSEFLSATKRPWWKFWK